METTQSSSSTYNGQGFIAVGYVDNVGPLVAERDEARKWARVMKERWEDAEKRVGVLVALIDRMEKQIGAQGHEIDRETNELYRLRSVLMQIATKSSESEIRVLAVDAVNGR